MDAVNRQADVEVYVRDCPLERALDWARSSLGALRGPFHMDTTTAYQLESGEGAVVFTPSIEDGPFMSVWFNTPSRPWDTDVECARAAVAALACVVRCDPGESIPGVSPHSDMWLELDGNGERVILWDDGDA
ncbi:MAG: hypothetical protein KDB73_05035 [Planctomycetes bacterium]|nr:hypothetical protein [Planctomycetota bacterium]